MALDSGSFQHRSWDSGFYFLLQFCVRFSVIVRFLQNASFEIGSSPLPPPPLSDGPLGARTRAGCRECDGIIATESGRRRKV